MDRAHAEPPEDSEKAHSPDLGGLRREWDEQLSRCRQNALMSEAGFIRFARKLGAGVRGITTGDPSRFHRLGWLEADGESPGGGLLFHPFRLYPLYRILHGSSIRLFFATPAEREGLLALVEQLEPHLPDPDRLSEVARSWNRVVDLAVLLEPAFWPVIVERRRWTAKLPEKDGLAALDEYRESAEGLVRRLDQTTWRGAHETLRQYAHTVDSNDRLYLLLRLSPWERRERLEGPVAAALWFRHIAEVIRRAFEEVHDVQWLEEDRAFGQWFSEARRRIFGAERPLDSPLAARPYLAEEFGLFTGSVVRWYVEGNTEYSAVKELLPGHHVGGIELINLKGNVKQEKDNIALKLSDHLHEDRATRRFSLISFDTDVPENTKAIRRRVEAGDVVGLVFAHTPDFEFANFGVQELVEVAARMDDASGASGAPLREGDWGGVDGGRAFAARYSELSARGPRQLKGSEWGRALADYAAEHPERGDNGERRPLWDAVEAAIRCRGASYDAHRESLRIDPTTFDLVKAEDERTSAEA